MKVKQNRIEHVPMDVATTPRDGECITNHWWAHTPGEGLIFYRSNGRRFPQCNSSRVLAEKLTAKLYPGAEVIYLPVVFIGPQPHHYA